MTAIGYISDSEDIGKASWSNFQHDGAGAFKLLEKSPVPPALCAKDVPGEWTQLLNGRQIKRIDHHPAESDEASSPESISESENWLNWNGDLDTPNDSEDDREADNESNLGLDNGIEDAEPPEQRNVSAAQNVLRLIQSIGWSKKKAEEALMTVNIIETRRNKGIKKKWDRMHQCIITKTIM